MNKILKINGKHLFTGMVKSTVCCYSFGELKFEEQIRILHHAMGKANFNEVHIGLSKV